jgi:opacity protein-like surface antigen
MQIRNPSLVKRFYVLAVLLAGFIGATNAADEPFPRRAMEVTVFGGRAFGGSLDDTDTLQSVDLEPATVLGGVFNVESSDENSFYEFSYLRENSAFEGTLPFDVSIEYFHVGGYVAGSDKPLRISPYFLATVGATRLTPDDSAYKSHTVFSAAVGGGMKFPITRYFGLRLDGRVYGTFIDSKTDIFCQLPSTGCAIHFQGKTVLRGMVNLGATVRF